MRTNAQTTARYNAVGKSTSPAINVRSAMSCSTTVPAMRPATASDRMSVVLYSA